MELFRIIKKDAKSALRFCGGRTVASFLILFLVFLAINLTESVVLFMLLGKDIFYHSFAELAASSYNVLIVTGATSFVYLLVIPALLLGFFKLALAFADGRDESIFTIFDAFSSFKKFVGAFIFSVLFAARYIISFAVALAPGGALFYFASLYIPDGSRMLDMLKIAACCVAVILMILGSALALIFVQRWALAPYYRADGTDVFKAFSLSAKATKDFRVTLLSFKFSFAPWAVFSVLVLPLMCFLPYYSISVAIFSKYLMERYERSLAETPDMTEIETNGQETD